MATNYYHSEERIYFGAKPSVFYGYYVSTTSDSASVTPFEKTEDREAWEKHVGDFRVAASLALWLSGNSEYDRCVGADLACDEAKECGIEDGRVEDLEEAYPSFVNPEKVLT